jgi:hypothetical protein
MLRREIVHFARRRPQFGMSISPGAIKWQNLSGRQDILRIDRDVVRPEDLSE